MSVAPTTCRSPVRRRIHFPVPDRGGVTRLVCAPDLPSTLGQARGELQLFHRQYHAAGRAGPHLVKDARARPVSEAVTACQTSAGPLTAACRPVIPGIWDSFRPAHGRPVSPDCLVRPFTEALDAWRSVSRSFAMSLQYLVAMPRSPRCVARSAPILARPGPSSGSRRAYSYNSHHRVGEGPVRSPRRRPRPPVLEPGSFPMAVQDLRDTELNLVARR